MKKNLFIISLFFLMLVSCNNSNKHIHEYTDVTINPTCTEKGYTEHSCECGEKYIDNYINPLGHTEVVISATNTCTKDGLSEGKKCSVCDTVLVAQTNVEALGHQLVDGVCKNCNNKYSVGLTYELQIDDTYFVSGIGTCTDSDITILEYYEGKKVTGIKANAFENCYNISSVNLPETLLVIEDYAFMNCYNLFSLTLPKNLQVVASGAFRGCHRLVELFNLSSINIEKSENYNELGYYPEVINTSLVESRITITDEGYVLFYNNNQKYNLIAYLGDEKDLVLPEKINDNPYGIRKQAFLGNESLESVVIPESIVSFGYRAFGDCINLKKVELPNTFKSINNNAFDGCKSLEEIIIPSSVTKIGKYAFSNCESLKEIVIPENVVEIGEQILSGCKGLEKLSIPFIGVTADSVENEDIIYLFGFNFPKGLEELTILYGEVFDENTFANLHSESNVLKKKLKKINLPQNLKTIGSNTFINFEGLEEITIPNTLTTIEGYAFFGCQNLSVLKFEDESSLLSIGEAAFYECNLKELSIPSSVTHIGISAFNWCTALESITIPFVGESLDDENPKLNNIFGGLENLKYLKIENAEILTADIFTDVSKDIETIILPNNLKKIGLECFLHFNKIKSITIPSSVETIENFAFYLMESLKTVIIDENSKLTVIGDSSFGWCENLETFIVPENNAIEVISSTAFNNCHNLEVFDFKKLTKLKTIGFAAFSNCYKIKEVFIPASVEAIENSVFLSCPLISIEVENGNQVYDSRENCNAIIKTETNELICGCETTIIPEGTEVIGYDAFRNCMKLTSITLPSTLKEITDGAFYGCHRLVEVYNLSNISIEKNNDMNKLGYYVKIVHTSLDEESRISETEDGFVFFNNIEESKIQLLCYNGTDKDVVLPDGFNGNKYELYKRAFNNDKNLESIKFSSYVNDCGSFAFENCVNLKSVILTDSMYRINNSQFSGCTSLESIYIPKSINKIQKNAFNNCLSLVDVKYEGTEEEFKLITIGENNEHLTSVFITYVS